MSCKDTAYQQRYGASELSAPEAWSPVIESLLNHRSVRHYLQTPVSDDQLNALMVAAQSSASSSNLQAWSVVAVRDPAARAVLAECSGGQAHVAEAPLQLVWLADLARLEHVSALNGRPFAALDYLEMFVIGVIDAALAAQNAVAAAESLGLGTVYIGGMRNQPERVAELLQLPPRVVAVFGLCVGVPDPAHPTSIKPRPPQSVVLHHERYTPLAEQEVGVAAYNAAMAQFYEQQNMNVKGTWAVHSAKRIADAEVLSGRDRLLEALHALGFKLN